MSIIFKSAISIFILASFVFSLPITGRSIQGEPESFRATPGTIQNGYGKMPLLFEANKGQTDERTKFISRGKGYTLYLTETGAAFSLKLPNHQEGSKDRDRKIKTKSDTLRMKFAGANQDPTIESSDEAVTKTNYYIGRKRIENVSNYRRIDYRDIYNGIDAVFYGNRENQLEYDFVIAPDADPSQIALNFDGAENISVDAQGDLIIKTENTELVQQKPFAYQEMDGEKNEVASRYVVSENTVRFELGDYDDTKPLVIDPILNYLTYIGGSGFDDAFEVAADAEGNAYVSGDTESLNFHGETRDENDGSAAYIAKIDVTGTAIEYLTILEGKSDDRGSGITLDANNNVFVVGQATRDFPVTSGAFDTFLGLNEADGFAAKLNPSGNLVYATYIGGSAGDDLAFDVAVDSSGRAYVVGRTDSATSFPQKNRYQGCGFGGSTNSADAYLTVLNASGSDITYSTCFGGSVVGQEAAFSIALDSSNKAYITGLTTAGNFPTKNAFQPAKANGQDGFVAKFNPAGSGEASLIYSTFLGGAGTDQGNGIAVNSNGQAHVVGLTGSVDFPLKNPFDSTNQINEGFVTVLNATGNALVNSSFLGGADQDKAKNVALDSGDNIYVTGDTLSNDFPVVAPFQATRRGVRDAFITKLKFGSGILASSYLGGNGNDSGEGVAVRGNFIYVVGPTASTNLLTTTGVIKPTTDNSDGFVAKILDTQVDSVGVFRPSSTFVLTQSTTNIVAQNATFTSGLSGQLGVSGDWNGDGVGTIGSFTNGVWKIRNSNFPLINLPAPFGFITVNFGQAGDLPVVGDWNGDGIDTPGVYRPSLGQFLLTNSTATNPSVELTITFGLNGDLPVGGDWNGDGIDTVGVFRPTDGIFFLTNENIANPNIDVVVFFGINGDLPIAGNWDGNGFDTIGISRPSTTEFFISNDNIGVSDQFFFGAVGDQPIVGDWDGKPNP